MKKILVLSSAESEYTVDANQTFVHEIEARLPDVVVETCHYRDVALYITKERIDATRLSTNAPLKWYDLIYFKSFYRYSEMASAIASYLQQEKIQYICHEIDEAISFSKLTQYARLSLEKLPIIPTVFVEKMMWQQGVKQIEATFGFPCIFKATDAKGGDANYLVHTADELIAAASNHECDFVAQELVPNEYDLRVLIADGAIKRVIKRQRVDETSHLNNTSKGASATLVPINEISNTVQQISCDAAAVFHREIAGVDIMTNSQTGEVVILEVNASPQVATGAFKEEKLDVYADLFKALLSRE
jgi:glutathione synthase/RimK-type ligase-like ATP-grasp enzyme